MLNVEIDRMDQFITIAGFRVHRQLLSERSTHDELFTNIETAFPDTKKRQHATNPIRITNLRLIPYIGLNMLDVRATALSDGNQYPVHIQFLNVSFEGDAVFTTTDGSEQSIAPIVLSEKHLKVRCTCLDFYFRFSAYNAQDNSLVGRPFKPYVRKTDTHPPANPLQLPGVCKHVIKTILTLESMGIIAS